MSPLPTPQKPTARNGAARAAPLQDRRAVLPDDISLVVEFGRILRNRRWVIVQALVLIPVLAVVLTQLQSPTYTATANLLFREAPRGADDSTDTGVVDPARTFATSQALVDLPVVSERAAKTLGGGTTAAEVRGAVTIEAGGDSDIVLVTAAAAEAQRAADTANAYAEAYIAVRRAADRARYTEAIEVTQRAIDELAPEATVQRDQLTARLTQFRTLQSLQTGNAEIVQRAEPPGAPSSPNLRRNLLLAILLALAVGLGVATLLERLDRRLKTEDDLERAFGLPIIARVPESRMLDQADVSGRDGAARRSAEIEAFRILRANLRYFDFGSPLRSILVASAAQGDGKSTVARNLAETMADMGDHVVLVEADLHKTGSGAELGLPDTGLSAVLAGVAALADCLVEIEAPSIEDEGRRLVILPSGPVPPNPSELLSSQRMFEVLRELERRFDLVVIDSPPISVVSDALALVPEVSGVVVVAGLSRSTRDAADRLQQELALLGGRSLGLVANFTERRTEGYYAYSPGA